MSAEVPRVVSPSINVTPLIDVLLVLLIIFMVLSPLRPARFKTSVPERVEDPRALLSPRTLVVMVDARLGLRLVRGKETVAVGSVDDTAEVAARLAEEWATRRASSVWKAGAEGRTDLPPDERIERTVFVSAPLSVRYGEVAKVIDAVKGAGASPVGLQTEALPD